MSNLQIQEVPTSKLKSNPNNVRTHPKKQIDRIAQAIRQLGFLVPIIANASFVVLAGHGRLAAARQLGLVRVPVITVEDLSDAQMRAFALADNKLAAMAGYDEHRLALEVKLLSPLMAEAGLDFRSDRLGDARAGSSIGLSDRSRSRSCGRSNTDSKGRSCAEKRPLVPGSASSFV